MANLSPISSVELQPGQTTNSSARRRRRDGHGDSDERGGAGVPPRPGARPRRRGVPRDGRRGGRPQARGGAGGRRGQAPRRGEGGGGGRRRQVLARRAPEGHVRRGGLRRRLLAPPEREQTVAVAAALGQEIGERGCFFLFFPIWNSRCTHKQKGKRRSYY